MAHVVDRPELRAAFRGERYWEAHGLAGAGDSLTAHEIVRGVLDAAVPPGHALC